MRIFLMIFLLVGTSFQPIFAQDTYTLTVDGKNYQINHNFDADVLAMEIDKEQKSLLIGISDTNESIVNIEVPKKVINAENANFAILIDGFEVDYELTQLDSSYGFTIFIPEQAQEVEIIGTYVVPEFTMVIMMVLGLSTLFYVIATSKLKSIK